MKAALEGHDRGLSWPSYSAPVEPRKLDRGFDGLGAAIGEPDPGRERRIAAARGQLERRQISKQIGAVSKLRELLAKCRRQIAPAVAEGRDSESGREVEISATVDVPDIGAFTT